MLPPRPTELVHDLLEKVIGPGSIVIDATAGNGHDTLFLATLAGESGRVLAFDVQEAAIGSARARIEAAGLSERVDCYLESHAAMGSHAVAGSVAAVMFNLGYLPGADHSLATGTDTLEALRAAVVLLKPGGALSVVCYPGHDGGADEAAAVEGWMGVLPEAGWKVVKYAAIGTLRPAPFLLFGIKGR